MYSISVLGNEITLENLKQSLFSQGKNKKKRNINQQNRIEQKEKKKRKNKQKEREKRNIQQSLCFVVCEFVIRLKQSNNLPPSCRNCNMVVHVTKTALHSGKKIAYEFPATHKQPNSPG